LKMSDAKISSLRSKHWPWGRCNDCLGSRLCGNPPAKSRCRNGFPNCRYSGGISCGSQSAPRVGTDFSPPNRNDRVFTQPRSTAQASPRPRTGPP
jgi:hypothetical protein